MIHEYSVGKQCIMIFSNSNLSIQTMFAGFQMDVTGNINERPYRLFELDDQTGSNANSYSIFRAHISRPF